MRFVHFGAHVLAAGLIAPVLPAGPAVAQDVPRPSVRAGNAADAVQLDGLVTEEAWNSAESVTEFTMLEPTEGIAPTLGTRVRILAGSRYLVIGIECEDPTPGAIVSYSKARDSSMQREDHVKLVLDTFLDGRSGYVFAVNPTGARYDALVSDRGERENSNWDEIWEAATIVHDEGWSAELRVPIRSLRFNPALTEWGLNVERRVERLQETSRWSSPRRDYSLTQTSRSGLVTGLPEFDSGIGLSVTPAFVGRLGKADEGEESSIDGEPSLDVTQLLGAATIASLTINTDFAETEVDTRRTNLTRFPLFFPEKRAFFLEGSDIFDFGLGAGRDLLPFFSRRIGLVSGETVPLVAGAKVNGRLGNTNFGGLATHTAETELASGDVVRDANMGVIRLQQNVLAESSIGFIGTAGDPLGRAGAWTAGADFTYQTSRFLGRRNFLVGLWGLTNDREDLTGSQTAWGFKVDYPNDPLDAAITYMRIGDGFDPSLGFVPRKGIHKISPRGSFLARPDWGWLRNQSFQLFTDFVFTLDGELESYRIFTAPLNLRLESGDRVEFNVVPTGDRPLMPFDIGGVVIPAGNYDWTRYRIEVDAAPKRAVSGRASWWFGSFYDGSLDQLQLRVNWNPSATFNFELGAERNIARLGNGDFTQDLASLRLGLNVSPDLVVSSFLQYDNDSESFGTNTRVRWTFSPVGELFVIWNTNVVDPFDRWRTDTNLISVKARYAWRR
ncbi:MAG: hypothetical protein GKS06_12200 [Acidobacteria bacterium]|nr:hypothetical protein [Acidobacteriota bacterium]